ncbi:hypothetical protein [Dyella choica]|uniref:Uncharacterized protein n=1 Tax=Dyella choica TaxID=1927959 RepID=A0A432LZD7_9GAMM|nr:hypothetical protein [Dyella choica]RUL69004.1 hypothetical protein EKH80_23030 [Dyella choica]
MITKPPTRTFAASFFALVALGTAELFTPILRPPSLQLAMVMPFLAAALAFVWAWLLYPRDCAKYYGVVRGLVVALLAYLSFTAILAAWGFADAGYLIVGFVYLPFPWLVLAAGAGAGGMSLRFVRARLDALVAIPRRVWTTCAADLRATYARLDKWATEPRALAMLTMIVSNCLLFAGGALGLTGFSPGLAEGLGMSSWLLPGMAALILAVTGWTCGRALLAFMPTTQRLRIALMSAVLAGAAAVWFSIHVAA